MSDIRFPLFATCYTVGAFVTASFAQAQAEAEQTGYIVVRTITAHDHTTQTDYLRARNGDAPRAWISPEGYADDLLQAERDEEDSYYTHAHGDDIACYESAEPMPDAYKVNFAALQAFKARRARVMDQVISDGYETLRAQPEQQQEQAPVPVEVPTKKYDERAIIAIVRAGYNNLIGAHAHLYNIKEVPPFMRVQGVRVWTFTKYTTDAAEDVEAEYTVCAFPGQTPLCSCPFHMENGDCKHAEHCAQTIKADAIKAAHARIIAAENAAAKVGAGRFDREMQDLANPAHDLVF